MSSQGVEWWAIRSTSLGKQDETTANGGGGGGGEKTTPKGRKLPPPPPPRATKVRRRRRKVMGMSSSFHGTDDGGDCRSPKFCDDELLVEEEHLAQQQEPDEDHGDDNAASNEDDGNYDENEEEEEEYDDDEEEEYRKENDWNNPWRGIFSGNSLVFFTLSDQMLLGKLIDSSIYEYGMFALYVTFVFSLGRFLRVYVVGMSHRIIYEDWGDVEFVKELLNDIYAARWDNEYELEEEMYGELIQLYRSPEKLQEVTRPPKKLIGIMNWPSTAKTKTD